MFRGIETAGIAANTNEFVDQINDWDRGRVEAQAKAWVPA